MLNNPVTVVFQLSAYSVNEQLEHSPSILLAELETLFKKTNTRRKLTVLLNEFGFYCPFCSLQ